MHKKKILLVDDEKIILNSLGRELKMNNFDVTLAESGEEALARLKENHHDLIITDLMMEGMDGIKVLKHAKRMTPGLAVIILTGHGDLTSAVDALRLYADDYLLKPCDIDELLFRISNAFERKALQKKIKKNLSGVDTLNLSGLEYDCEKIIGQTPPMLELKKLIHEVAQVKLPVLVQGETGTGKELVAEAIHQASSRRDKSLIAVNCAALPHDLLESELFGHVKGAFTGAIRDKKGRFELANSGTIFLDEIGELDPNVQVKLLRVLQEGAFERLGGTQTIKVDVRLISATNKNLDEELKTGNFRLDLYYRLCVVPITISPLRERKDDIPLLTQHIVTQYGKQRSVGEKQLSPEVLSIFKDYPWPGNVRELQNVIQFSLMKSKGEAIELSHLPTYIAEKRCSEKIKISKPLINPRKNLDQNTVMEALEKTQGNKVEAAKVLGVGRATLYRFIKNNMPSE